VWGESRGSKVFYPGGSDDPGTVVNPGFVVNPGTVVR